MNFLFSIIGFQSYEQFLPLTWGSIRQYCEYVDERDFSEVNFMDPIFDSMIMPEDYEKITDRYDWNEIDVLFLSNYVWNWKVHINIAAHAKRINPNIVIIGGGPGTLFKEGQDLHLFKDFDFVTPAEAEEISAEVLYRVLHKLPLDGINDLIDPKNPVSMKTKRIDLSTHETPYLTYADDYIRFADGIRDAGKMVSIILSTNRGCPYKCAFCDWGSLTNTKLKRFDPEKVIKEIEFICEKLKPGFLFNVDANVGILDFDIEVTDKVIEMKKKCGYPEIYFWTPAKNNKNRVGTIARKLFKAGLNSFHQLSFQHFDKEVLSVMERDNISIDIYRETMDEAYVDGVPLECVLILGNPGDTPQKWEDCLQEAIDMNFDDIRIHDYMLLPNAPAASPEYKEKYQLETMKRYYTDSVGILDLEKGYFETEFVSSCFSYSEADYAKMLYITSLFDTFYQLNFAKYIAAFLFHTRGIKHFDFFRKLEQMNSTKHEFEALKSFFLEYVYGQRKHKFMPFNMNGKWYEITPEYYTNYALLEKGNSVFEDMKTLLIEEYDVEEDLAEELIAFQKITMRAPVGEEPGEVSFEYNIIEYFKQIHFRAPYGVIENFEFKKSNTRTIKLEKQFKDFDDYFSNKRATTGRRGSLAINTYIFHDY